MNECNCITSNSYLNFSLRSNTPIKNIDKDLSNFLDSNDFDNYSKNFNATIIEGEQRLLTYNNTTIQVLWLPTILEDGEKQILYTFYNLNSTEYFTFILNSLGDFSNLLDMSVDWNLWNVDKTILVTATFAKSTWVTLAMGNGLSNYDRSIAGCITRTLLNMGPGSSLACALDPEMCILAIGIDCAYHHLMN
jgi:hypothetical protein